MTYNQPIPVLAGNDNEYRSYLRVKKVNPKDYLYVTNGDAIRGRVYRAGTEIPSPIVGTFWERMDAHELYRTVRAAGLATFDDRSW